MADAVKESREMGGIILDTIEGLAVIADDPNQFERVSAGQMNDFVMMLFHGS